MTTHRQLTHSLSLCVRLSWLEVCSPLARMLQAGLGAAWRHIVCSGDTAQYGRCRNTELASGILKTTVLL